MSAESEEAEKIFAEALALSEKSARNVFLDRTCEGKPELRREIESLISAYEGTGTFLEIPAGAMAALNNIRADDLNIEKSGDRIGRYKLLEKIGRGGFGDVWMAEQEEPVRRRVALKIVKLGMDTREVVARFHAERQALALMDHPTIAKVFDGGATDSGRPYFVMELVRGTPITTFCEEHRLSIPERVALFVQVCQAVQHAHQKGVIHRDIKPSNVLVSLQEDRPAPKVIDFGIAKAIGQRLTDSTFFTRFHQFLGTPAYMSPEQTGANREDIDTRTDIYSLGVLLYELLTGKTPFEARKLLEIGYDAIVRVIREEEPPKPSTRLTSFTDEELREVAARRRSAPDKLGKLVRGDLDWIAMKCLEKDRARRYDTANALALDLQRQMNGEPVLACPPSNLYRIRKFARRNRTLVGASTAVVLALVSGMVVSTWQWRRAAIARSGEARQHQVAEGLAADRREQLVRVSVANGVRSVQNDDWFAALLWFAEGLRKDAPASRGEDMHRYRLGSFLNLTPRLMQLWTHEGRVNSVIQSHDGEWILTASRDHTARLWNAGNGASGPVLRHGTNVTEASFTANAARVLTLSDDGIVHLWDASSGRLVCPPLSHGYYVRHALIDPTGERLFTAGNPAETNFNGLPSSERDLGELRIYDASGKQIRTALRQKSTIHDLSLSADGQWLAVTRSQSVVVWNLLQPQAFHLAGGSEPEAARLLPVKSNDVILPDVSVPAKGRDSDDPAAVRLAFSPDSRSLAVFYGDGSGCLWPLPQGKPIVLQRPRSRRPRGFSAGIQSLAFAPHGRRIVLVDGDGVVRFWDARTGEITGQLIRKAVRQIPFSRDSRLALVSGQVWDIENDSALSPQLLHSYAGAAAFGVEGSTLVTGGDDGTVRLWDLSGGNVQQPPLEHDGAHTGRVAPALKNTRDLVRQTLLTAFVEVRHAVFSVDSQRVLTVSGNGSARVWSSVDGKPLTPFVHLAGGLESGAFSADGSKFAAAGGSPPEFEEGLARVWDARTGGIVTPVITHREQFHYVAFSPDGRWLITQSRSGSQVWNAETGEAVSLPMISGPLRSIAFSGNETVVAVCVKKADGITFAEYETRSFDLKTGLPKSAPLPLTNEVTHMAFSPDGRWLLTFAEHPSSSFWGHGWGSACLWNAETGQPVTSLPGPFVDSRAFVFTRDHRRLIIPSWTGFDVELPAAGAVSRNDWRKLKIGPDSVTRDGRYYANIDGSNVQVNDAATEEPITPPLHCEEKLVSGAVIFGPDDQQLLARFGNRAQLWPLWKDSRPIEDLVTLAQLLAGRAVDASGKLVPLSWQQTATMWQSLRTRYPEAFMSDGRRVRQWHERLAESSEKDKSWFSAVFHLDQLSTNDRTSEPLRVRIAAARNELALEDLK